VNFAEDAMRTRLLPLLVFALLVVPASVAVSGQPKGQVVITHARADSASETLMIEGRNFGPRTPVVQLDAQVLAVLGSTDSSIAAVLPQLAPRGRVFMARSLPGWATVTA
jgi:hypothetical protein